jgi:hypothetical protein
VVQETYCGTGFRSNQCRRWGQIRPPRDVHGMSVISPKAAVNADIFVRPVRADNGFMRRRELRSGGVKAGELQWLRAKDAGGRSIAPRPGGAPRTAGQRPAA